MCGIAGLVSREGIDPQVLVRMTHLAKHRGPDGFGFSYHAGGVTATAEIIHNENRAPAMERPLVGLGNRRLAILDLSAQGNMPMQLDDGAYCVTYNGEIYNCREIRAELQRAGYRFRSGTDTEVLLRAYQHWGEECLHQFNGMWSFALWDRARQALFCARDRFGVKPFYYAVRNGWFYFASEIKQLIHGAGLPRVANARAVYHFLDQGLHDYSSDTFFEDIQQLPGGHALRLELAHTLRPVVYRYWELRIQPHPRMRVEEACEEFHHQFRRSVSLRLRSDVPVGATLSGGLDSSAVLCEASSIAPGQRFHTFSACYDDPTVDERQYVAEAVSATRAESHLTFPNCRDFWKNLEGLIYQQDEPVGSASVYAQWCVMAEARKCGVPVLLGGQGGDETLCGYKKYRYFYLWLLLKNADPRVLREMALGTWRGAWSSFTFVDASRYFPTAWRRPFSVIECLCSPEFRQAFEDPKLHLGARASLAERQKADLTFASLPSLLRYEDRNSMAHSIESRLPFLDYELVQFAVNCPSSLMFHGGWSKWILREALAGTMPERIRRRKSKLGFSTPQVSWMRSGLKNGRRDLWDTRSLQMERFVSPRGLAKHTRRFLSSRPGSLSPYSLFRAVSLELWARVHGVS